MKLIGIAGRAGVGKDTVANYLVEQYFFEQYAFAKPIRDALKAMFNLTDKHFEPGIKEQTLPEYGVSPRQMAQWLGTEFGRDMIGQDVWVRAAQARWDAMHLDIAETFDGLPPGLVVSDVRFEDEAQWIREQGGALWIIHRPDVAEVATHSSEDGFDLEPGDTIIPNIGTIEQLYTVVDAAMEGIS